MNLEETISAFSVENGHVWKKGEVQSSPTPEDVRRALDEAAKRLYNGKPGDLLIVVDLLILKTERGYDAYVLAGNYK